MNCESGESLNASVWCGFSPNARQIRLTAVWLIPVAAAIDLVDQCVAHRGCSSSVFTLRGSHGLIVPPNTAHTLWSRSPRSSERAQGPGSATRRARRRSSEASATPRAGERGRLRAAPFAHGASPRPYRRPSVRGQNGRETRGKSRCERLLSDSSLAPPARAQVERQRG